MSASSRQELWKAWDREFCERFPQVREHTPDNWPDELGIQVEDIIFADQSLDESARLAKAEQAVLAYYAQKSHDNSEAMTTVCIADAVRLQVQEAFEHWKVDASTA